MSVTILVADDEPLNRYFLSTLLGYEGVTVIEAADGAEALERVRQARPALVITDIKMPNLDGYDLVHHIRADAATAGTAIVLYTAHSELDAARLHPHAVDGVVYKPSEPETILDTIRSVLGRVDHHSR